jgi:hypothetical protein
MATFLVAPAWGKTLRDIHLGCEARQRVMALPGSAKLTDQGVLDTIAGSETIGYISGWVDAMSSLDSEISANSPNTVGGFVDAICKYVDLHPELWSKDRGRGIATVVTALYGKKQ